MRIKCLVFILIIVCFVSCWNYQKAMRVSRNFSKEYTELDTLIRIDGYYYKEDSIRFAYEDSAGLKITSLIFFENGEFKRYGYSKTHEELQNIIVSRLEEKNGSYSIQGDTIKTKWVLRYGLFAYRIYESYFIIENDTTLRQIWYSCDYAGDKTETKTNEIYHFYEYKFDIKE